MSNETYEAAAHRMQSATRFLMESTMYKGGEPKHLRVGINSAMSDQGALAGLLIEKGVFTREEYVEAVRLAMIREADEMTDRARKESGIHNLSFG